MNYYFKRVLNGCVSLTIEKKMILILSLLLLTLIGLSGLYLRKVMRTRHQFTMLPYPDLGFRKQTYSFLFPLHSKC
jgi:hypothetical protein